MMKKLLAMVLAASLLLMSACALAEGAKLTVQGSGTVLLDADRATISVGVREVAKDVIEAQRSVNERIAAIIDALIALGIEEKNISTSSIGIYPNYDYSSDTEKIIGYTAYNTISAVTDDIENTGKYIDAAFEVGANTLDGVNFSASDTEDASNQALALALTNARNKAQALADAAGMTLGGIASITENTGYNYNGLVMNARTEEASDKSTRVLNSYLQVSASVTVEFALENK